MKICYDLHIHSALSPCADNGNTPVNIIAAASCAGIEMLAVADHNSIKNVEATMQLGDAMGITVVPAMELQTAEDIHLLCLFENFEQLKSFYKSIKFTDISNKPMLFGEQLIVNSDDEITGEEPTLLSVGADILEVDVFPLAEIHGGIAVPAHINRDANGIVAVLGGVPDYYSAVELSYDCDDVIADKYKNLKIIYDSDSHNLENIGSRSKVIELTENSTKALLSYLKGK